VCGWRSVSDRSGGSNIVYDSLPCRFILGKLKLSWGFTFDLDSVRTSSWISVLQRQKRRWKHGDNNSGTETGRHAAEARREGEEEDKREL